jgi:heptosyltransferase I
MALPLNDPPRQLCLIRLSAVGDITHTLPVVRTLQQAWPDTRLTWIIGKTEHGLVYDIPGIEFIVVDKKSGWRDYWRLYHQLRTRRFDVLLHMQMSLRASLISLMINSPVKLGFDRRRAKDFQWLFSNHRIAYRPRQHVIDSFFGFSEALGIEQHRLVWDIPIPQDEQAAAMAMVPGDKPYLVISPCSSMEYRNWHVTGYAAIADYAHEQYGLQVILTGGPSTIEHKFGREIRASANAPVIDLIGQTNLKQLLAILEQATVVISPDAGPAHLATAVGTPVIGLYATTNPDRARPYLSARWTVNKYPEAVFDKHHKPVEALPWGTRVRDIGTMDRIKIEDVKAMLDNFMRKEDNP